MNQCLRKIFVQSLVIELKKYNILQNITIYFGVFIMNICRVLRQFLFFLFLCLPGLLAMEIPIADPELTNFFFNHAQGQRIAFVNEKIGIKSNPVEKYTQASMPKSNKQPMTYQSINRQFQREYESPL